MRPFNASTTMRDDLEETSWGADAPGREVVLRGRDAITLMFGETSRTALETPELEVRLQDEWGKAFRDLAHRRLHTQQWFIECVANGYDTLTQSVVMDPNIRGGLAVLRGTGFTVSQALAELAETGGVTVFAEEFDIDPKVVMEMLGGLSLIFQRPCRQ